MEEGEVGAGCHYNINPRLVRRKVGEARLVEEARRNHRRICSTGDEMEGKQRRDRCG